MISLLLVVVGVAAIAIAICRWMDRVMRRDSVPDLVSKRILVTGTDSGFGRHLAQHLCHRGMTVYAACYTDDGVKSLANDPGLESDKMKPFKLDVTSDESVNKAKKFVVNDLPEGQGLWALVNNAGIVGGVAIDWTTADQYHEVMNVNLYGQVRMTNAFLPLLKKAKGRLVNVASIMGRLPLSGTPYVCSKFAIEAYTCGLRRHVSPHGVKVSIIEPGTFKTNLSSADTVLAGLARQWKLLPEGRQRELGGETHKQQVEEIVCAFFGNYPLASRNRIQEVTDSISHAVTSQRPKARYVCGLDARFMYRPISVMPDWLQDRLLNFVFS